jgi:hypothetical protein
LVRLPHRVTGVSGPSNNRLKQFVTDSGVLIPWWGPQLYGDKEGVTPKTFRGLRTPGGP